MSITTARTKTTAELLHGAAAGDQDCWNGLFRQFNPLLRSVVSGYRLDPDTTGDVCQTVWMRLFEYADRIRQPERLAAWLVATAKNEALRNIRRQKRARPSGVLEEEADLNAPAPDERAIDKETVLDALEAFGHLPDDSQELLRLLVATPPLPYTEIAERIGRPIGSIGPTRRRCIEALKSHMDEFSLPAAA